MQVWHLIRGGELLAILRSDGRALLDLDGQFTIEAAFEPMPALEHVRSLFEREIELIDHETEVQAELEEWSEIWEELMRPGLFVESIDRQDRWDILWIHFHDDRAWWWPLWNSPKTILRNR